MLIFKDHSASHYNGPEIAAEVVARTYTEKRDDVLILDVAAGTGLLGEKVSFDDVRLVNFLDKDLYLTSAIKNCDGKVTYSR